MNNKNYISEEAFEELVNGLDFIGSFTLYGRKRHNRMCSDDVGKFKSV